MMEKIKIDSFSLKIIAMGAMLLNHIGVVLFPQVIWLRLAGRIAFPIFAYLIVEGFFYTQDLKKYFMRIGGMALVSEIPFDLAISGRWIDFQRQNVFFTLFLGLVFMYAMVRSFYKAEKIIIIFLLFLVADVLRVDYGSLGLLMIVCFYCFRERMVVKVVSISLINIILMGYHQVFGALAMIPIGLHNRQQGRKMKWLFYSFYPVHLLFLVIIKVIR